MKKTGFNDENVHMVRSDFMKSRKFIAAAVFAMAAAVVYGVSLDRARSEILGMGPKVRVAVASGDLEAGTRLDPSMLKMRSCTAGELQPGAYQSIKQAAGRTCLVRLPAGTQVTSAITMDRVNELEKGWAVTCCSFELSQVPEGFIKPQDHVDISGTFTDAGDGGQPCSVVVAEDAVVLKTGISEAQPGGSMQMILKVRVSEVLKLNMAVHCANLGISLRSPQTPAPHGVCTPGLLIGTAGALEKTSRHPSVIRIDAHGRDAQ